MNQIDFIASFASLLDVELPDEEAADSRDSLPALLGQDAVGLECMIEESFGLALLYGDWKYNAPTAPKWPPNRAPLERGLYHLKDDPGETKNVIAEHPELADSLEKKLQAYVEEGRVR